MVLDRDYPMTGRQARVLVVGLVVMSALGIALFGGLIPGVKPNFSAPATVSIDGHLYYAGPTLLHYPLVGNATVPWNVTFHNVTFQLAMTDWSFLSGGIVRGTGTEANGTHYGFLLGILPNGSRPTLYISPDGGFGAAWDGGWLAPVTVLLLVEVPPTG